MKRILSILVILLTPLAAWAAPGLPYTTPAQVTNTVRDASPAFSGAINLDRIARQMRNLDTMDPATTNFTVFSFGDSVAQASFSPANSIVNHIAARYGLLSANQDDYIRLFQVDFQTLAGGAVKVTGPDSKFWADYVHIPSGGSVEYTNASRSDGRFINCYGPEMHWVQTAGGGSCKIQYDSGSGYTDLITVSSTAATQGTAHTNVSIGGLSYNAKFKVVGLSGDSYVTMLNPCFGITNTAVSPVVRAIYGGKGGVNIGNGAGTLLAMDSNTLWTAMREIHPDLVVWHARHEASWSGSYSTNAAYFLNIFKSAAPQCEVLLFGSYPSVGDDQQALCTPILKGYALTNGAALIDLAQHAPGTNYAMLNHWFISDDGLHYKVETYDALLKPYLNYWGVGEANRKLKAVALTLGSAPDLGPNYPIGAGNDVNGYNFYVYTGPNTTDMWIGTGLATPKIQWNGYGGIWYAGGLGQFQMFDAVSGTQLSRWSTNGGFVVSTNEHEPNPAYGEIYSSGNISSDGNTNRDAAVAGKLIYRDANGKETPVTIGANVTFSGGTLSASGTGGGGNTNITYSADGGTLVNSNLTLNGTLMANSLSLIGTYQSNWFGVLNGNTNMTFTNVLNGLQYNARDSSGNYSYQTPTGTVYRLNAETEVKLVTQPAALQLEGGDFSVALGGQFAGNQGGLTNNSGQTIAQQIAAAGGGGGGTNAATTVLSFADPLATDLTTPAGCITNGIRKFRTTATASFTLSNPSGTFQDGQQVTWEIIQDGTGGRVVTMGNKFAFGTDITGITLSTTASKRDFITAIYNGTADKWYVVGFTRGY